MEAIQEVRAFVTALEAVNQATSNEEPARLLKWLHDGKFEALKPQLAAYLMERASALNKAGGSKVEHLPLPVEGTTEQS
ncbi:Hypothetical protein POVN_LOCUS139 [uncultured virus]|nr:Hypothetical protein POVN_LOCUS139 [uncultured virus]